MTESLQEIERLWLALCEASDSGDYSTQELPARAAFHAAITRVVQERDATLRQFAGYLTGYLPELHKVEMPRMAEAVDAFRAAQEKP